MTAAAALSQTTLDKICARFPLEEVRGADGAVYRKLNSPMGPVGDMRIFRGQQVHKMVYIGMTVPQIGLDSHMIFAFTPPHSAVPHFTLDSVMNTPDFAFHLDLIPRVDLGADLDYINAVYTPLNDVYEATARIDGLKAAKLGPTQYAVMSAWMLVYRATPEAFDAIQSPVDAYLNHWFSLVENGVPNVKGDSAALAERDRRNRAIIFDPTVDRVWAQVDRLLGAEMSAEMRRELKGDGE
jgi:hypothetical protein